MRLKFKYYFNIKNVYLSDQVKGSFNNKVFIGSLLIAKI